MKNKLKRRNPPEDERITENNLKEEITDPFVNNVPHAYRVTLHFYLF